MEKSIQQSCLLFLGKGKAEETIPWMLLNRENDHSNIFAQLLGNFKKSRSSRDFQSYAPCADRAHVFSFKCTNVHRNPSGVKGGCSVSSSSGVWHQTPIPVCDTTLALSRVVLRHRGCNSRNPWDSTGPVLCSAFKKDYNTTSGNILGFHLHSSLLATNCRIIPEIHIKFMV